MALSYGISSPRDLLSKAERDLSRLETAEKSDDSDGMSDSLFDLAIAVASVKDWLKEHPGSLFTPSNVEAYVAASVALGTFRDIANAAKHRVIRHYVPNTTALTLSATGAHVLAMLPDETVTESAKPRSRLKIIRADGSRYRAVDLGHDAVREWRTFMNTHGITT
jgi:hypothetical protein